MKSWTRRWAMIAVGTLAVVVVVFGVSSGHWGVEPAGASDPALPEFVMEVKGEPGCTTAGASAPTAKGDVICSLNPGDTFTVSVFATSGGSILGDSINALQAVVEWSPGLDGPGEAEGKTNTVANCPAIAAIAPNPWQGRERTSGVGCAALFTPMTNAEIIGVRTEFIMTCSNTPSQELVSMVVGTGTANPADPEWDPENAPQNNTHLTDPLSALFTDKDGTEVLTIHCGTPPLETPTDTATPTVTPTPSITPTPSVTPTPTELPPDNANVTITKTDSPDPVGSNSSLTYTLQVRNLGLVEQAENVVVVDALPPEASFGSADSGCTYDGGTHEVTCALGTLAANDAAPDGPDEATVQIKVITDSPKADIRIRNVAVVSASNEDFGFTGDNRDFEETVVLGRRADLTLTKTDDEDPVSGGGTIIYTLTAANIGPQGAENVVITDTLPIGVTFVPSAECTLAPANTVTCDLGSLASGAQASVDIEIQAPSVKRDTLLKNEAFVSADNELFADTGNNLAIENTAVVAPPPDLTVSKSSSPTSVFRARFFSYSITVTNIGSGDAFDVVVTDVLPKTAIINEGGIVLNDTPQPVTFIDAEGAVCTAAGENTVECLIASVPGNGGETKITLNVRAPTVIADTTMVNSVSVSDPDEPTEPAGNNSDSANTLVEACFDVDGDEGVITIGDIGTIVLHFGEAEVDPEYDLLYDIDDKGAITISDIGWVVSQFGQIC